MTRALPLTTFLACAAALATAGCGGDSTPAGTTGSSTVATAAPATTASTDAARTACQDITTSTTEGPYYVTGTARLSDGDLNVDDLPGEAIAITGHVYAGTGTASPLAGAVVDIWQADGEGRYWPQSNGPASGYADTDLSLRGSVVTDAAGAYTFTTIFPGEYEGRARHIHVRATSADGSRDVITQLIMSKPGDRFPAESDDIARSLPACHTMTFSEDAGRPTATFDFHLG